MAQVYDLVDILFDKQKFVMMYINTEFNQLRVQYNHLFENPEIVRFFEQARSNCIHYPTIFDNHEEFVFETLMDIRTTFQQISA